MGGGVYRRNMDIWISHNQHFESHTSNAYTSEGLNRSVAGVLIVSEVPQREDYLHLARTPCSRSWNPRRSACWRCWCRSAPAARCWRRAPAPAPAPQWISETSKNECRLPCLDPSVCGHAQFNRFWDQYLWEILKNLLKCLNFTPSGMWRILIITLNKHPILLFLK